MTENDDEPRLESVETLYDDRATSRVGVQVWKATMDTGAVHVLAAGGDVLGAVAVIVGDGVDGPRILLGRHHRMAISPEFAAATGRSCDRDDGFSLEFPRGRGHEHEDAIACACREAGEETGLPVDAAGAEWVGWVHADAGILSDRVGVVVVHVGIGDKIGESDDELESWRWETPSDISAMIGAGRIDDALTLAAWAMTSARGLAGLRPAVEDSQELSSAPGYDRP